MLEYRNTLNMYIQVRYNSSIYILFRDPMQMVKATSELQAPIPSCFDPASWASIFWPVSGEIKHRRPTQLHRPINHPVGRLQGF